MTRCSPLASLASLKGTAEPSDMAEQRRCAQEAQRMRQRS